MAQSVCPPQYMQIALDIASRITRGELTEGSKIYGRSVMASEYGVSPETIRRSMKLLADMQVVRISAHSGIFIDSAANAAVYIERFGEDIDTRAMQTQLKDMIERHHELSKQIESMAASIAKVESKATRATPFNNYEIKVPKGAGVLGKNLAELRFWQATGATIIAIQRGEQIILSPGPYAQLYNGDIIIFVGDKAAVRAAEKFVSESCED